MVTAYEVLGVAAGADRVEIRGAYVNLAKQLHPDRNADSMQAEQRLRDVNQAYEQLKDPERRLAYDQLLQQSRGQAQGRRRRAAVVMAASFALTAIVASALLFLARFSLLDDAVKASGSEQVRVSQDPSIALSSASLSVIAKAEAEVASVKLAQPNDPTADEISPQQRVDQLAAGALVEPIEQWMAALQADALLGWEPADVAPQHDWVTYYNDRFGFAIDYPADVFTTDDQSLGDYWRLFVSRDGQARLLVTAGFNVNRLTPAAYRQSMLNEVYREASLEYAPLRNTWFVLAGSKREDMFYERATFACDKRIIHRWRLTYPSRAREYYSQIIERMHQGYKHVRGAGRHCG